MNTIQGKNIGGYMKVSGVYYPIFCGKSLTFSLTQDILETTNVSSGNFRDYEAGMSDASMEIGGVSLLSNTGGRLSVNYLMQQSVRRIKQEFKITQTDDDGGILLFTFTGLIVSTSFDKTIPGFSQSSLSVKVCGPLVIDAIVAPGTTTETIYSDWWVFTLAATSIGGASSVQSYNLIGVTILEVDREGVQHDIITVGTPVNRQVKHNNATGTLTFSASIPSNGETVFVLFKRVV